MKNFFLFLVSVIFFGITNNALAANYWVSPTGTETNKANCTGTTPLSGTACCQILSIDSTATAGDTIYFREGIYPVVYYTIGPNVSGTADNPITFAAYNGESVELQGNADRNMIISTGGHDYVIFDGFKITTLNTNVAGPQAGFDGDHNIIRNCEFVGNGWEGITNSMAIYVDSSSLDSSIMNNYIHDYHTSISRSDNTVGLMLYGATNMLIENNTFEDNNYDIYLKKMDENNIIRYNFSLDSFSFIECHMKGGDATNYQRDHEIYQNIVVGNDTWLYIPDDDSTATNPITGIKFYNNTFHGNSGGFTWGGEDRIPLNFEVWNNIFSGSSNRQIRKEGLILSDYNNYYNNTYISNTIPCSVITTLAGWQACSSFDANSVEYDPKFINASGTWTDPSDYKRASYPTDGRGGAYATVMGAYVTGNEVIGYTAPTETCTDSIQNQDETGIDCGGVCEACVIPPTTYGLSNFISAITNWLGIGDSNSDVNSDGVVNTRDLGVMMSGWGE